MEVLMNVLKMKLFVSLKHWHSIPVQFVSMLLLMTCPIDKDNMNTTHPQCVRLSLCVWRTSKIDCDKWMERRKTDRYVYK